jgi:type IV pilus assembly protein PilA
MVSHPPHPDLALQRVVGCEALPLVAGVYFAGLQLLLTYWAVLRLRDAGHGPLWALLTWSGALPGLAAAAGHPLAGAGQMLLYGLGILATLAIGALEPAPGAGTRIAREHWLGRHGRRLLLPVILLQVLVLAPRSDAALARWLIEDGMRIAPVLERAVEARWRAQGRLPGSNQAAGLPPPEGITGNAVALSGVAPGGRVFLVFDHPRLPCPLRGIRIERVPEVVGEGLLWRCVTDLDLALRPRVCR